MNFGLSDLTPKGGPRPSGSGVSEPQVAKNRYLPLTGGIALTTMYALTCYTVMLSSWFSKLTSKFLDAYAEFASLQWLAL